MDVEVKICGLTRPQDATAAAAAGASWLGVVFAGGPRAVAPVRARRIVAAGGGVPVLGVFGSQPADQILRVRDAAGLSGAQLHGPFGPDDARRLRAEGLAVWRVVRVAGAAQLAELEEYWDVDAVLVEPRVSHAAGGSGSVLQPQLARAARLRLAGRRMVLAGGLTPETVGEAVGLVAPDGVDVSSGVETLPGVKDPIKIARFVEAVRGRSAVA